MGQQIKEKSRYKILREFGYSAKEAQKFRRYGYDKFLKKIQEKADTDFKERKFSALERTIIKERSDKPQTFIKRLKGESNQLRKYNYICVIRFEDRQGKEKKQYVTLKSDRKLTVADVYSELYNLSWFYRDSYDMKRILGYYIQGVKVRQ